MASLNKNFPVLPIYARRVRALNLWLALSFLFAASVAYVSNQRAQSVIRQCVLTKFNLISAFKQVSVLPRQPLGSVF